MYKDLKIESCSGDIWPDYVITDNEDEVVGSADSLELAQMIVAAPKLFEALKKATIFIDEISRNLNVLYGFEVLVDIEDTIEDEAIMNLIKTAISNKARGSGEQ